MPLDIVSKWDLEYADNRPTALRIEARCEHDGVKFGLYAVVEHDQDPMMASSQLRTMLENAVEMHDQNKPWRERIQGFPVKCL